MTKHAVSFMAHNEAKRQPRHNRLGMNPEFEALFICSRGSDFSHTVKGPGMDTFSYMYGEKLVLQTG
eukprot:2849986-Heterocapsa_arctica.AAC.1